MKILIILSLIILPTVAFAAADFSADTSSDKSAAREKSMSVKNSIDKKISQTASSSTDSNSSKSNSRSSDHKTGSSLDLSIPARALIGEDIAYRVAADFDLAAKKVRGGYSTTYNEYIASAAKGGALVRDVVGLPVEFELRSYMLHIAEHGARMAESQQLLNNWCSKLGVLKKDHAGNYRIVGIGAADLVSLSAAAWIATEERRAANDQRINRDLKLLVDDILYADCRLVDVSTIQCGKATLRFDNPPTLRFRGQEWYGQSFAGVSGTYRVSSSWSLADQISASNSVSQSTKNSIDQAESEGRAYEATMLRKQAISKSKSTKSSLSATHK